MTIHVTFDPTDADDVAYVTALFAGEEPTTEVAPAPKKTAAKKAAPAPDPETEKEEEEESGPTMEQAVEKATELVSEGRAADVKGALATFGVKRVTELEESQIGEFLTLLDEESVV